MRRGRGKYAAVNICVISEKGDVFVRRIRRRRNNDLLS
jgi:hypothetical protein